MMNKKVFFLSHVINEETALYGGERSIVLKKAKSIKNGDSCNTMNLAFPSHTGTHIDVPSHFIEGGLSITDFESKDWLFKKISLIEIPEAKPGYIIKPEDINDIKNCELFLIKTGFEKYRGEDTYWRDSPALHPELAHWLKQNCPSIRAVGVDLISISNLNNRELGREAHKAFLGNDILLIEDMRLSPLKSEPDLVVVAPLLLAGSDGSPCTVLAL